MKSGSKTILIAALISVTMALVPSASNASTDYYKHGQVTFKPLNVNIASMTVGLESKDSSFQSMGIKIPESFFGPLVSYPVKKNESAWRSPVSLGFQESDSTAVGYGVEGGYMLTKDWEVFGRIGYASQRPDSQFQIGDYSLRFKPRSNLGIGIGARRYFDFTSRWKPFVGFSAGLRIQGDTTASFYAHSPTSETRTETDAFVMSQKLYGNKTFASFELMAGTDYTFTDWAALTLSVAVRYTGRGGSALVNLPAQALPGLPFGIPPRTIAYRDNRQRWFIPIMASLKFIL